MSDVKIAIVEDEALVAEDIRRSLLRKGFQVIGPANSGEAGIELCERERPNLVLMDVRLKGSVDGIEASRIIRDRFKIPVIFLTANSDAETLDEMKLSVPYGLILKPFSERELEGNIRLALYHHDVTLERESLLAKLEEATRQIRQLEGMLPMCAQCKSIRNDQGYWQAVEAYLSKLSGTVISHSVCPNCIRKLYPEIADEALGLAGENQSQQVDPNSSSEAPPKKV